MNFFVLRLNDDNKKELITCPLDGSVLPGVTRESVIQLANEWGIETVERPFNINDLIKDSKRGRILEAFGSGTACLICPISQITHNGVVF